MKRMLMGLFLLLLSVWCYIVGVVENFVLFSFIGAFLPIPAIIVFLLGFFHKGDKS